VLIWIHGGWLQLGDPMFDSRMHPWELISKNGYGLECVVVAVGYRLNIFGFLGADVDGLLSGNWGFWDQRCAIEWISENVKYFGGDNTNVTLGGVSAGNHLRKRTNDGCVLCSSATFLRTIPSNTRETETNVSTNLDVIQRHAGRLPTTLADLLVDRPQNTARSHRSIRRSLQNTKHRSHPPDIN